MDVGGEVWRQKSTREDQQGGARFSTHRVGWLRVGEGVGGGGVVVWAGVLVGLVKDVAGACELQ